MGCRHGTPHETGQTNIGANVCITVDYGQGAEGCNYEQTGRRYGGMRIWGTRQRHDRDETRYPGGKTNERSG